MAVVFTVGLLAASWLGVTVLAGILFVLGCALAAWFTRPSDLLIVVLTPPILFCGALVLVEAVTASGSLLLSVATGCVVVLVSLPLWLAAGLVVTVAIAVPRGLLRSVMDLIRDLGAELARGRAAWARYRAARAARQPAPRTQSRRPPPRRAPAGPRAPGASRQRAPDTSKPGSRGTSRAAGSTPRGPGASRAGTPVSRGPGKSPGPTPGPGSRRAAPQAREAPESADRAAGAR